MQLFPVVILGQLNHLKCDILKVKVLNDSIENLSQNIVNDFLMTFDKECKNNAEYSEWSNETLFLLLARKPDLFLQGIQNSKGIDRKCIISEIENPIKDIDLKKIYSELKSVNMPSEFKESVCHALKTAAKKESIIIKE